MAKANGNDELHDLFSAFDDMSASAQLKDATLERIFAGKEEASQNQGKPDPAAFKVVAGSGHEAAAKRRMRPAARRRALRVAAIAACFVLALSGGVAYAVPVSYVEIAQGQTTVDLGVNCFGITVCATSDDGEGKQIVDSAQLRNVSRDESLFRVVDAMEQRDPSSPVAVDGEELAPIEPPQVVEDQEAAAYPEGAQTQGGAQPGEPQPMDDAQLPEGEMQYGGEGQPGDGAQPSDGAQPGGELQSGGDAQPGQGQSPEGAAQPFDAQGSPGYAQSTPGSAI